MQKDTMSALHHTASAERSGLTKMSNGYDGEYPTGFTHSIKLEGTAKGFRPSVHCYGNGADATVSETIKTLKMLIGELELKGIPVAPMIPENNKELIAK